MGAAIGVRSDYISADMPGASHRCDDADQVRRLLAAGLILDGGSRSDAAKVAGMTLQIVRHWALRFSEGGHDEIATYPVGGWWKSHTGQQRINDKGRYALVMSMATPGLSVDLHARIEAQVQAKVAAIEAGRIAVNNR